MRPEIHHALLQCAVTIGLAALSARLHARYRHAHYRWWTLAWILYSTRVGVIIAFLATETRAFLFFHQILTGWTAIALLAAALTFAQRPPRLRSVAFVAVFPIAWSAVAIYQLDNFLAAALPAVLFLSAATFTTAALFYRRGHKPLALAFALWALHHLDYPFLRARGAWVPWGYYLDIVFTLAVGAGMLLLVIDDLSAGVRTLATRSFTKLDPRSHSFALIPPPEPNPLLQQLTSREHEVLTLIAAGLANKQIAAQLDISIRTVESHRERLMKKLGINTVAGLTRIALESGLHT